MTQYQRTFSTPCPVELIDSINANGSIPPNLTQIINLGTGDVLFDFDGTLTAGEESTLDSVLGAWTCPVDDPADNTDDGVPIDDNTTSDQNLWTSQQIVDYVSTNGGGGGDLAAVQARRTTVFNNIPLSWIDLTFNVTDFENDSSVIEHLSTTDRIQVKEAGTYEIYYFLTCDDEVQGRVRVNDSTVIPGSTQQSGDPNDVNNVITPLSVKVYATLAANDFLTVQIQADTSAENLFADAIFLVKKLEGGQGPKGDPGDGASVIVNDEGVAVPNGPFSTLNFTGAGVTASDAGSGVTTVDIPGTGLKTFFLAHNGSTTQTLTTSFVTALFNTNIRNDSPFVYSGGVVTINKTGWFKITSEITATTTNSRSGSEQRLAINGSAVTGTLANGYHRQTNTGRNTHTVTWLVNITSGDNIRTQIREYIGTCVTVANSCRLMIEEVDGPS